MTETDEIILGVDAGGTFTDFVCLEISKHHKLGNSPESEVDISLRVHKTLSTPSAPEQAIMSGIDAMGLGQHLERGRLHIIHGSTVATNAALEGKFARTAFVTNHGLSDMLTLGRQTRPELYALEFPAQHPPVPKELCLETGGRLAPDGSVVEALSDEEIESLVKRIVELAPDAVAINLLFSFIDDRFERAIEKALKQAGGNQFISRSSNVLPVYREYERGIATWLNAALGPVVSGYLGRLQKNLRACPLQIMQSSGETIAANRASESAVHLLLSGPAGGLTAMRYLGRQIGVDKLISFDMGGTSTDVALLKGDISISTEGSIDRYPVAVPMVDMHTIGAGGGSIAFCDSGGLLQVGPQSAGADPGPACYGKGGRHATVTDANLVLGRLLPNVQLAGGLELNSELALARIEELANQISMSVPATAQGIVTIANEHMAKALRLISVNRGHDPKDFVLASFGGAGGLHVCAIADAMQMRRAMVPAYGGVLSALGMLTADRGRQFSKTIGVLASDTNDLSLGQQLDELAEQGKMQLGEEGIPEHDLSVEPGADVRYQGQSYTLNVVWENLNQLVTDFSAAHQLRYGYALATEIEIVNLRVKVFARREGFSLPKIASEPACNKVAADRVYDETDVCGEEKPAIVLARTELAADQQIEGPAIITEYAATTYVASTWQAEVDELGNLMLNKQAH